MSVVEGMNGRSAGAIQGPSLTPYRKSAFARNGGSGCLQFRSPFGARSHNHPTPDTSRVDTSVRGDVVDLAAHCTIFKLRAVSGGTLAVSRREIRAQHELALETPGFEASMRFSNFIQRDPRGDARLDSATDQQSEQVLQVLHKPSRMLQPRRVDRIEERPPAARQPPPEI